MAHFRKKISLFEKIKFWIKRSFVFVFSIVLTLEMAYFYIMKVNRCRDLRGRTEQSDNLYTSSRWEPSVDIQCLSSCAVKIRKDNRFIKILLTRLFAAKFASSVNYYRLCNFLVICHGDFKSHFRWDALLSSMRVPILGNSRNQGYRYIIMQRLSIQNRSSNRRLERLIDSSTIWNHIASHLVPIKSSMTCPLAVCH